jgi:hypothetical protein
MMRRLAFVILSLSPTCYRLFALRPSAALGGPGPGDAGGPRRGYEHGYEGAITDLAAIPPFLAHYWHRHSAARVMASRMAVVRR